MTVNREFRIYPYKSASEGAKMIRDAVDGLLIKLQGSTFVEKDHHVIINWGNGECPFKNALNHDVSGCIDKIEFFKRLEGTGTTPEFCTSEKWNDKLTFPIFQREVTDGYDGAGISIADNPMEFKKAKLYVQGINAAAEYRVHIGRLPNGTLSVIGVQKKVFITPEPGSKNIQKDKRIMCGDAVGLSYVGAGVTYVSTYVGTVVHKAFEKFPELTFGAFDVIVSGDGNAYVLEVNSAPMMTEQVAKNYGDFFKKYASLMPALKEPEPAPTPQPQPVAKKIITAADVFADLEAKKIGFTDIIEAYVQKVNQ
jgi:hypothetical protein